MKPNQKFDLTKSAPVRVDSIKMPPLAGGNDSIIEPKGPRLNLVPIGGMLFVDLPQEIDQQVVGGIHVPAGTRLEHQQYRVAKVASAGPDVRHVKPGDSVMLHRSQIDQVVHDGHSYWRTREDAVVGIVR